MLGEQRTATNREITFRRRIVSLSATLTAGLIYPHSKAVGHTDSRLIFPHVSQDRSRLDPISILIHADGPKDS